MSLAIAFPTREHIPRFLRLVVQPQVGYAWGEADRFVVVTRTVEVRDGRRTIQKREHNVWLWLPDAAFDDPGLKHAADLTGCGRAKTLPADADGGKHLTLDQFLRAATPVRPRTTGRKTRHDLLAAFYDVPPQAVAEAFAAVPKNPAHPSALEVLESTADPDTPRCLLRLPQADPAYPWQVWVEAESRRLAAADGRAAVKLFTLLPGGTNCDFYVEFGYVHPFPELGGLYHPPANTRLVLISARDRDGKARTQWAHLVPRVGDALFDIDAGPDVPFEFELPDRAEAAVAVVARSTERLRVRPRVESVSAGERADLEAIERSVQGAKNTLARLEQSRAHLLARRQGRFRFLLGFDQPAPAADAVPELAPPFQRFLLLARRQADQLQYVFVDRGGGAGRHLVYTRDPVFYRDLHIGLADASYYQPADWPDWGFEVFVRDDCELLPRIDAPELARPLFDALSGAAGPARPGEGRLLLIDPADGVSGHLRVTAVAVPPETDLPGRLGFVNTDYPVASVRSRAVARDEMVAEMTTRELALETEVRRTEETISAEALARLDLTRAAWDATAAAIDRTKAGVDQIDEHRRACGQLLERFAGTWVELVTSVLRFNDELVAPKLDALAALTTARAEWTAALDRVEQGHANVAAMLPPIRAEVEQRVRDGQATHARVAAEYVVTERLVAEAERDLTYRTNQIEAWRVRAQAAADRIEEQHRVLTARVAAIRALLDELDAMIGRLETGRIAFVRLDTAVRDATQRGAESVRHAGEHEAAIRAAVTGWRALAAAAKQRQTAVDAECGRAETEVAELRQRMEAAHAAADAAETRVREAAAALDQRRLALEARAQTVRTDTERLVEARDRLVPLADAVKAAAADRAKAAVALAAVAAELNPVVTDINDTRLADVAALSRACAALAADLDTLTKLELEAAPLRRLQRAARVRTAAAVAAPGFDPLTPDVHAQLYGGS